MYFTSCTLIYHQFYSDRVSHFLKQMLTGKSCILISNVHQTKSGVQMDQSELLLSFSALVFYHDDCNCKANANSIKGHVAARFKVASSWMFLALCFLESIH